MQSTVINIAFKVYSPARLLVKMGAAQPGGPAKATFGEVCSYASCGAELKKPLVCARCKGAAYCCKECQVKDWKAGHKQDCNGKVVMDKELVKASLFGHREVVEKLPGKAAPFPFWGRARAWTCKTRMAIRR